MCRVSYEPEVCRSNDVRVCPSNVRSPYLLLDSVNALLKFPVVKGRTGRTWRILICSDSRDMSPEEETALAVL